MLRSVRIFQPCVKRCGRDTIGLSNFDDRKRLAVNEGISGVRSDFQNFLQFFDGKGTSLRLFTHKLLLCALCAEVYMVVKVHLLTRKAILQ